MSRGRRKNSSQSLSVSTTTSSLESLRCRYPASFNMVWAASVSAPLLGTARRSMVSANPSGVDPGKVFYRSEMLVDLVEPDAPGDHEDLDVVEQLRDLFGGPV